MDRQEGQEIDIKKFKFALVEISQLEKLLAHCHNCGRMPGGKNTGKNRTINWTKTGSNLTAVTRCACVGQGRLRWSTQEYVPETNIRTGNLSIVASCAAAPIPFVELDAFSRAADIPMMGKTTFCKLSKKFVFPTIEAKYMRNQSDLYRSIEDNINVSLDGSYDSPGFTAQYCTVAAVEESTKQVLEFTTVQKHETANISTRMELEGVKRVLAKIKDNITVNNVTVDKNPSVCKYFKDTDQDYSLDQWHITKSERKSIFAHYKTLQNDQEKQEHCSLGNRYLLHLYNTIETTEGTKRIEKLMSFFLHVQHIHAWNKSAFSNLIHASTPTTTGKSFDEGRFEEFLTCSHEVDVESKHDKISPNSKAFQFLLVRATRTAFLNDILRVKYSSITSDVESFNNVSIVYHPKRKFYPRRGYEVRTMLASLSFNANKASEEEGTRGVQYEYRYYSKAVGDYRTKKKRGPTSDAWKKELVEETFETATNYYPDQVESDAEDQEGLDILDQRLADLLLFDDSEEENMEIDD